MKTIHVVCAILREGDRVFATQRGYGDYKDSWEFPGGKLEPGETPQAALRREIREELDAEIHVGDLLVTVDADYPGFHLHMDCFWAAVAAGELKLKEHEAARWVGPEVLEDLPWLPADRTVAARIREALAKEAAAGGKAADELKKELCL